eukprot:6201991-Pleurochrysis_carterae.AAC.1
MCGKYSIQSGTSCKLKEGETNAFSKAPAALHRQAFSLAVPGTCISGLSIPSKRSPQSGGFTQCGEM